MSWRFADLPVRTKFLVTLGIPVAGLVLLIGKQVDSSIKRRNVLRYISVQSRNIDLLSDLLHQLQQENGLSLSYLTDPSINRPRLQYQYSLTDEAAERVSDPELDLATVVQGSALLDGIELLRQRVEERRIGAAQCEHAYRHMKAGLLDDLSRVAKLALDAGTKDRLYSHLSLLSAGEALANVRSILGRGFSSGGLDAAEMGDLFDQMARYNTSMLLFERDASPEVVSAFRAKFEGPDVNLLRTTIGTVHEKRSMDGLHVDAAQWWEVAARTLDKLEQVEHVSIARIVEATTANQRDAEFKLAIVLLALFGVIGAVAIMAFVVVRGIRRTVVEVTVAAKAIAEGDLRVRVPVTSSDEFGEMAASFNRMTENVNALAESAGAIGKGNYDTAVPVRGPGDVLGVALTRMKENLKAARTQDAEQKAALENEKEKLERANDRIKVLIKEIHHRVKNNLQVIASLLRLQSGSIEDERLQHVFEQSQSRVTSMALIHEKLYRGEELAHLDLDVYIRELFAELVRLNNVHDNISCRTRIDQGLEFDLNTMVPFGLVLNELITNSFKHAFPGRGKGSIALDVHRVGPNEFDLIYKDDGVGMPQWGSADEGTTLGTTLIESLTEQLNGHFTVDSGPQGTAYHIRFRTT
ncbi:MAG: nitrate- and nitrite sensing domain-containing protein [Flavobacteriales bacterium]|nr:nitrate- and nitrite sensing domain-containing protein [Flavobacteriales bacterium]MCB9194015.1 nitrate- and nitrite sensing domain-containing protein [Flavobacteriales bacterium]